ncbi:hypothetical protein [Mycobacterium sp. 1274761.0]|uniref:hypothetical protein n=1 Tax=Mycobacterium sp. 1274761.0 TaxID=1834077 RepID=UPI0007FCE86A|nr:hypothetical protein [Mycobacterium sp. 1274761.0]OBK71441.1 hypothetical protein A5651_18565 [Mycobacterium sp. 1274761.0]
MRAHLSKLWVRNVIAALVAVAAIAVVIVTGLGDSWATYRRTVTPGAVVPAGQSGNAGGYTWKIASVRHLNRSPRSFGPPLPAGTVLTVVTVERTGPPPPQKQICKGVITDGQRRWKNEGIGGFAPPERDGVSSMCDGTGLLQFSFLLPNDVVPTAMDVVAFDGTITVRLLL